MSAVACDLPKKDNAHATPFSKSPPSLQSNKKLALTGVGNGQGVDYFNMPSTRSVLAKLQLNL